MTRDTFDQFTQRERGLFGGNEQAQAETPELLEFTFQLRCEKPFAIAVMRDGSFGPWIWLPRSKITSESLGGGKVRVSMPEWLAKEKGLV